MALVTAVIHNGDKGPSSGKSVQNPTELAEVLNTLNQAVVAAGDVTSLTDNSGGSAADTIAVIGGTYDQAEVSNAIASLAAKINAILAALA